MFANRHGLAALMKDGGRVFSGMEEATLRNIDACKVFSNITKTSFGPKGMNKLIVNHLDKRFVTSDTAVMLNELDVQHPAAKLLVMASQMQEEEFGDATNLVLVFAGELLNQASILVKQGIHSSEIIKGYEWALNKYLEHVNSFGCWTLSDAYNKEQIMKAIATPISTKQVIDAKKVSSLLADASLIAMPPDPSTFNPDNIRIVQIPGGSLQQSYAMNGMILPRDSEGSVKRVKNCNVMVLGCGLEATGTEATGTVLLKNADELLNFTKGEERQIEQIIKDIKAAGVGAIVANGSVSDIAQHYCNEHEILTLRVPSKFDTRRICRSLGATALVRLGVPTPDELGVAESISIEEIASKKVAVIVARDTRVSTILLRGATKGSMQEIERALEDGIGCLKSALKSPQFARGAGHVEIMMGKRIRELGETLSGLDQYSVLAFASALELVPIALAEAAGLDVSDPFRIISLITDKKNAGINVEEFEPNVVLPLESGILDHLETKISAVRLAVDAVLNVLRVDQIIMAKPAGGPALRPPGSADADD